MAGAQEYGSEETLVRECAVGVKEGEALVLPGPPSMHLQRCKAFTRLPLVGSGARSGKDNWLLSGRHPDHFI